MYYQVFFQREFGNKISQVSCDNWQEVQEEIERLSRPKLVTVEYHNQEGLYGVAKKFYSTLKETYITYHKTKFQNDEAN